MQTNPGCASCDYFSACKKVLKYTAADGTKVEVLAKEQIQFRMRCVNQVEDICKDCTLFNSQRCASWKILNGERKKGGTLRACPKKVPQTSKVENVEKIDVKSLYHK